MGNTDFNWILNDVDQTLIFMIKDTNHMLDSYQVSELRISGTNPVIVREANIMDLTGFVNLATIRFVGSLDKKNIVDIPLRKLALLYESSSDVTEGAPKGISLPELDTFAVYNDKIIKDDGKIYGYRIGEVSDNLKSVMDIARHFNEGDMKRQLEALKEIYQISYARTNKDVRGKK